MPAQAEAAAGRVRGTLLRLLDPLVRRRAVVLTGSVAGKADLAELFGEAGAREVHSLPLPEDPSEPIHLRLARMERLLADPPAEVRVALDAIDPGHAALAYAGSFTARPRFCGRRMIGARRAEHFEAERKDRQAELLGPQPGYEQRLLDLEDVAASAAEARAWSGESAVVLSGIPREILALGSSHTWFAPAGELADVLATLAADCPRALLAKLSHGVPCTYYGYVSSGWTVDFGPFEALVYGDPEARRISAIGIVRPVFLDGPLDQAATAAVHQAARRLNAQTGYAGAFCTDGVLQTDRYVIHEINPRVCAGFSLLGRECGGPAPLTLADLALRTCPAEADGLLREPLSELASALREQRPLLKLWDPSCAAIEKEQERKAEAIGSRDGLAAWVKEVRDSLRPGAAVPLADYR